VTSKRVERRSEARARIDEYYSVEFFVPGSAFIYQFRIWNLSSHGICLVVKASSDVLKHLKVGDVLNMKYHPTDMSGPGVHLKTKIKHITKQEEGRFTGHALVGLFTLKKQTPD